MRVLLQRLVQLDQRGIAAAAANQGRCLTGPAPDEFFFDYAGDVEDCGLRVARWLLGFGRLRRWRRGRGCRRRKRLHRDFDFDRFAGRRREVAFHRDETWLLEADRVAAERK